MPPKLEHRLKQYRAENFRDLDELVHFASLAGRPLSYAAAAAIESENMGNVTVAELDTYLFMVKYKMKFERITAKGPREKPPRKDAARRYKHFSV